jgi:ADP-ribose pyrophosphatase YjhB (NUDIX family)
MTDFNYQQPFTVISALVVRDGKILLIKENHYPDAGKWNIPGGKLNFGESTLDTAKREVFEESGVDFTPTALLGVHSVYRKDVPGEVHAIRIVYVGEAQGEVNLEHGDPQDDVAEIADFAWFTPEEILSLNNAELRYHDIKLLVQKWQQNTTYPLEAIEHIAQL